MTLILINWLKVDGILGGQQQHQVLAFNVQSLPLYFVLKFYMTIDKKA